jgi:hypothetical protein
VAALLGGGRGRGPRPLARWSALGCTALAVVAVAIRIGDVMAAMRELAEDAPNGGK